MARLRWPSPRAQPLGLRSVENAKLCVRRLLHLPDGHSLGAQFVEGVAGDLHGCADRQQRHDAGHDQVRPARPSAEHTQRRQHHGDIAQRIVAAAQPDTAHAAVAFTVGIEHERHGDVGQQCDGADDAHRRGLGHAGIDEVVDRDYRMNRPNRPMVSALASDARPA